MELANIVLNAVIAVLLIRLLRELKLTKCAIKRFELLKKCTQNTRGCSASADKSIELMEIK